MPSMRSGSSSRRALSCSVSWATSTLSRARKRKASMPTSASTRRTPAPTDCSPSTLTRPSWPELCDVGAAAELAGVVADLDDADLVAVLLAEQRQRAHRPGLRLRGVEGVDLEVVDEDRVDLVLDVAQHARRHRARRGEVEAEAARASSPSRPAPPSRRARCLKPRWTRWVAVWLREIAAAPLEVDLRLRLVADLDLAAADLAAVHDAGRRAASARRGSRPRRRRCGSRPGRRAGRRPRRRTGCGRARPRPSVPAPAAGTEAAVDEEADDAARRPRSAS